MTRTQEFIQKYKKVLTSGADFFNPDTSLMPVEAFSKAKCRMLVIFPTPHVVKTVSSTAAALNDFIITHCKDTFIDFAYMPENEDIRHYDEWNVPYAIGNITHLDPSHFDIVGFSISVLHEVVSGPSILSTFDRCDKPIPLFWSQRKDMPIGSVPLIYAGGITAACGESMFGKVNVSGKIEQGYMDFVYLGDCGHTHHITNRLIEALETGKVHRAQADHDVPGYIHKDIENFEEVCNVNTMQDFIDSMFDLQEIYQPQAYEVEYNKHNRIIKNVKINPKAQDFVKPYYPFIMEPDLGIGRTIINANGDSCGTTQTQVAEGCSAAGSCSFCSEGNYTGGYSEKTSEEIIKESWEAKKYSAGYRYKPYSFNALVEGTIVNTSEGLVPIQNIKDYVKVLTYGDELSSINGIIPSEHGSCFNVELSRGVAVKMSPKHKQVVFTEHGFEVKTSDQLRVGDWIPTQLGKEQVLSGITDYYYVGLWFGDGVRTHSSGRVHHRILVNPMEIELKQKLKKDTSMFVGDFVYNKRAEYIRCSKNLTKLILSVFPDDTYKDCVDNLFKLSLQDAISFIKGWYDADGSTTSINTRLVAASSKNKFIEWASATLWRVGIATSILYNVKTKATNGDESTKYATHLCLVGNSARELFNSIVGTSMSKKVILGSKRNFDRAESIPSCVGKYLSTKGLSTTKRLSKFVRGIEGMSRANFCKLITINDPLVTMIKEGMFFVKIKKITELKGKVKCYDLLETKNHVYKIGTVYTHNCNYLTDYKGMLANWIQIYPKVTFINMRMEELGRDTDALRMMKLVGSNRISAPMEGMSPRIQNNLLNKCLSTEALNNFMNEIVHQHLTDIKVGGIFTAYEEDEDFQWQCDFVDRLRKKAAEEGGGFPYRLKCCLTGDALTPIPGSGLVRQKDMVEGPVCGYYDSFITAVKPQGLCKIYKLATVDGTVIKGTPEHPVLVDPKHPESPASYKFIKDLKKGDIIYGRLGTNAYGSLTISESLCKIIGWYLGDGYVNKHDNFKTFGFMFGPEEEGLYHELWDALCEEGLKPHVHKHQNKNVFAIRVHNAVFSRMLKDMFGHTAHGKRLGTVLQMTKECQSLILKYWFAADGTVVLDKSSGVSRIKLESVNFDILQDLKAVLANMGIGTSLHEHHAKCNGKEFKSYTIEIRQPWVEKFANEIGIAGVKGDKIVTRERKGTKSIVNGYLKMYVRESEQIADEITYGFTVDNGTYVTNGIVSHNTPLVHYALTPIEYLERKSARKSYNGEHWLTDEWYEKFREHNIHFKVNGFRYSTYLEQSFIDLGRSITDMIYRHFIKEHVRVYSLRSCATDDYIAELKSITDDEGFFGDRDPEHYISPCHRIHIDLMGSYIPRARRLLRHKNNGNVYDNEMDIRCLNTYVGAKTKCFHNCIIKDPLKVYNDVTMDEEGNLHGEFSNLNGCERCQTPQQRIGRLKRPIIQSKNSDDIIATPRIPQVQKVRFVIRRDKNYDCLNPLNVMHTVMTKFLQLSDELLHNYHSIINSNMFWQSAPGFKDFQSGFMVMDTMWSKNSIKLIKELIPEANKHLKTAQVVSAESVLRDEKILITDYNVYTFESTLPKEMFAEACLHYKGQIFVEAQVQGFALTEVQDKKLKAPLFIQKSGKTLGSFAIPCKYNPVMYMKGFLSQAKKTSEDGVVTTTEFDCKLTVRETRAVARQFNEPATISVATGKPLPFGLTGLCNILLSKL